MLPEWVECAMATSLSFWSIVALARQAKDESQIRIAMLGWASWAVGGVAWLSGIGSEWAALDRAVPVVLIHAGVVMLMAAWLAYSDRGFGD